MMFFGRWVFQNWGWGPAAMITPAVRYLVITPYSAAMITVRYLVITPYSAAMITAAVLARRKPPTMSSVPANPAAEPTLPMTCP